MSKKQKVFCFTFTFTFISITALILVVGTFVILIKISQEKSSNQEQSTATQESKEEIYNEDTLGAHDTRQEEILIGSGTVTASGEGNAYIEGNGTVAVSEEKGTIIVIDNAGDAEISLEGFQNRVKLDENKWKYTNTGSATVTGSDTIVEASGQNIQLTATGTGTATLKGTGIFAICTATQKCIEGQWREEGIEVKFSEE